MKRELVESEGGNLHFFQHHEEVLGRCEDGRALDRAPRVPIAGTATVSALTERLQIDTTFLEDITASHVVDVSP